MTGRGQGYCADTANPGFANTAQAAGPARGRGRGLGLGRGLGRRCGWGDGGNFALPQVTPFTTVDHLAELKNQSTYFGQAQDSVNRRIAELENELKQQGT